MSSAARRSWDFDEQLDRARSLKPAPAVEPIVVRADPTEPDWRFSLTVGGRVIGEGYFDADHGWDSSEHPRGWTLRVTPAGPWEENPPELPLAPQGRALRWAARDAAVAEALRVMQSRLAA
jgi:hypothetical protein